MSFTEERKKLKNKVKGGSKNNFRSLKKWNVENKILYGIMYSHNLPVSDLAEIIGVSPRSVQAWLFEGEWTIYDDETMVTATIVKIEEYSIIPEDEKKEKFRVDFEGKTIDTMLDNFSSAKEKAISAVKGK